MIDRGAQHRVYAHTNMLQLQAPHICRAHAARHFCGERRPQHALQISARARIASRSGVGVGVGTASTTAKRSFDDDSPRMSQLKVLVDHAARRHCVGCRLPSRRVQRYSSSACSDRTRILTVAWPRCARSPLSRSGSDRSKRSSCRDVPDRIGDRETRRAERSFFRTPYYCTAAVAAGAAQGRRRSGQVNRDRGVT